MKLRWSWGLSVLLLASVGCSQEENKGPTGVVYEGKHTSEWGDIVCGPDAAARLDAAKVLARMGKEGINGNPAIPGLQKALRDEDPVTRGWASVALVYASRGTPFPVVPIVGPVLDQAAEVPDEELQAEVKICQERLKGAAPAGGPLDGPGPGRGPRGGPPSTDKDAPGNEKAPPTPEKKSPTDEEKKPPDKEK
jgi:hypothetical protein